MKLKFKEKFILIICFIFLLQPVIQEFIYPVRYLDDFIAVFMLFIICYNIIRRKEIKKNEFKYLIIILSITIIGLLGNYINNFQTSLIPIMRDWFNVFKVFFVLYGSMFFYDDSINKKNIINKLTIFVYIIVSIALICLIVTQFTDIGMNISEVRYGLKSFNFIYDGAGMFAMYLYVFLFIMLVNIKYYGFSFVKIVFISITLLLCLSTLRTRAFIFVILYLFLISKIVSKKIFQIKWYHIILFVFLLYFIGYDSYKMYFGNENTARSTFAINSINILKDEFPIGTGFGTFGTDVAYKYYSKVYYKYDMTNVYGLSLENGCYSRDTYWPAIIGEFGISGLIFMLYLFILIFRGLYEIVKDNKTDMICIIYVISVLCITSLATSTFFHYSTVAWFFMLPLMFNNKSEDENL